MSVGEIDVAKQQAFAGRTVGVLNDACLALMAGLGHESGLFDVITRLQPSTSEEVALAAGLDERSMMIRTCFWSAEEEKANKREAALALHAGMRVGGPEFGRVGVLAAQACGCVVEGEGRDVGAW